MSRVPLPPSPVSDRVMTRARQLRQEHGWSARELAERMTAMGRPTSRNTITNTENGRRNDISVDDLIALADALGTTVHDLIDGARQCKRCWDVPPIGFTCNACGRSS